MAEQGKTPDLPRNPKDREVLDEIARLIHERRDLGNGSPPAASEVLSALDMSDNSETSVEFDRGLANALFEAFPAGVALVAADRIHLANTAFALAFGHRNADEVESAGGLQAILPDEIGPSGVIRTGGQADVTTTAVSRSGRRFDIAIACRPVRVGQRTLSLILLQPPPASAPAPAGDTTASPLDAVADALAQGTLRLAEDGTIIAFSDTARRALGQDDALQAGTPFAALFAADAQVEIDQALARLADGPPDMVVSLEAALADDASPTPVRRLILLATPDDPGGSVRVFLERRAETAEIQDGGSDDGQTAGPPILHVTPSNLELLAKVSHEIRTPLNSIIGFSEFMKEERLGPIGNDKYRGYIDDIHNAGQHAISLINDLLDLSKLESGNFEPNFTAVDANEIVAECVRLTRPQAQRNRIVMRRSLTSRLPQILADRRSLKQILLNLLSNAIKFTEAGGQVIAGTSRDSDGNVHLSIRDTGVGMTEAEIAQALKPFRQLDTAPRSQDGTGLGLPLSKALAEANRARLDIKSTRGRGTDVDIVFPKDRLAT